MDMLFPPTIVLRHRKENLKKCSLRGLEAREDFCFYTYPREELPPLHGYIYLVLEGAPPLSKQDAHRGLFVLDATWRYAERMEKQVEPQLLHCEPRTLPGAWVTAYPRKQDDCPTPERGLASIEAIYISYLLLGHPTAGLFDQYYWAEEFLRRNAALIARLA